MKKFLLITCIGSFAVASAFAASPCNTLKQLKGEPAEVAGVKKSLGRKIKDRVVCAMELSQMQQAMRQIQQSIQASQNPQTNQNGGRAKYAMDGVSVGDGYYLDRSGSSATNY